MGDAEFNLKVRIINEVKQRPIIYNKAHPKHYIRAQKEREFDLIGTALSISGKSILYNGLSTRFACNSVQSRFFKIRLAKQAVRLKRNGKI